MTMKLPTPLRALAAAALLALFAHPLRAQDPLARGLGLFNQNQWAAARRAVAPYAASHPNDARAAFWMGRTFLSERRLDDAVEWLEKAVDLDGRVAAYHLSLGNAYGLQAMNANVLRQAILARRAKLQFDRAVELSPGDVDSRWGLMRYYMLAPGLLGGDVQKALDQAAEIRRRSPWRGMNAYAVVYNQVHDYPALVAEMERGVRQFPDSLGASFGLVSAYEAAGRPAAAFELLESLIRRRPDAMAAYYQLGRVGAVTGQRLDRAEQAMGRYLAHKPRAGEPPLAYAHWRMGMIYERQGRRDPARAEYRTAVALDPSNGQARAALTRLGG
jgi:tetratricopeptide (TPR) repeat protein